MTPRHFDDHGDWDALATAYALSALDREDEAQFMPHLATCARCTETVREATGTAGDLAYAAPDEQPPPALKQRLMTAVALAPREAVPPPRAADPGAPAGGAPAGSAPGSRVSADPGRADRAGLVGPRPPGDSSAPSEQLARSLPAVGDRQSELTAHPATAGDLGRQPPSAGSPPVQPAAAAPRVGGGLHSASDKDRREQTVVPLRPRARRWQRVTAAAAAVAVIAGLGGWNVKLRSDERRLSDIVAQWTGPVRTATLRADGTRLATLIVRPGGVDVVSESMPPNTSQTTYWLWALDTPGNPNPVPIGGFDVRSDQSTVRLVRSDLPRLNQVPKFAVSVEKAGITPVKPDGVLATGDATG